MSRWVIRDQMERVARYDWPQCRFCGRAQIRDCRPVACLLCGSVQCHGNGSGNGRCKVCYFGRLPGWSGNHGECDRASWHGTAVGVARKCRLCRAHIEAVKYGDRAVNGYSRTVAEFVAERLAHRDSGKGREHWLETWKA